jgi:hypothetical protein
VSASRMVEASELMKWFDKHDIVSSKVCVRTPEGGIRGLFAKEDIAPFEGIAVIPSHMIIQPPYKDLEEMVKVKAATLETKDMHFLFNLYLIFRNMVRISISRPSKF